MTRKCNLNVRIFLFNLITLYKNVSSPDLAAAKLSGRLTAGSGACGNCVLLS